MRKEDFEAIRRQFIDIDTSNADVADVLRQYFAQLNETEEPNRINPLAEPISITELAGEHLEWISDQIYEQADELDGINTSIVQTNNAISAELTTLENLAVQAKDSVRVLEFAKADEGTDFIWQTDSFNSDIYIDKEKTNAFVNINQGEVSLRPVRLEDLNDFTITIDTDRLVEQMALPGANILIEEYQLPQTGNPRVFYEQSDSRSLSNLTDGDAGTWFEVERNFIPPVQKIAQKGKAWISDSAGQVGDIREKTSLLDWDTQVAWPGRTSTAPTQIARFVNPDSVNSIETSYLFFDVRNTSFDTELTLYITPDNPREVSSLWLSPYIRAGYPELVVKEILAFVEGLDEPIVMAQNKILNNELDDVNSLTNPIPKLNAGQVNGVSFQVPTDRKVQYFKVTLVGKPVGEQNFAHPFVWVNIHRRSERKYFFASSVDHEDIPKRLPIFEEPPIIEATQNKSGFNGSIFLSPTINAPEEGEVIESENKKGPLQDLTGTARAGLARTIPGNVEAAFLIGLADSLIGSFLSVGGFSRDFTVTDQDSGFDVFRGYRSSVALRDVSLHETQYSEGSVIQTVKRTFPVRVKSFGLFITEEIPTNWPAGDWIEYSVSFDNGSTWQRIQPLSGRDVDQSIQFEGSIDHYVLRATIKGNPQDPAHTPKLLHYAVKGLPA